jgi:hypothetical protein
MIKSIDISKFQEDSYQLNDNIEILWNEEGFMLLCSEGIFDLFEFEKNVVKKENFYILYNKEKDQINLTEEEYDIIKELFEKKVNNDK